MASSHWSDERKAYAQDGRRGDADQDGLAALVRGRPAAARPITIALSAGEHQVDGDDLQQCVNPAAVKISHRWPIPCLSGSGA